MLVFGVAAIGVAAGITGWLVMSARETAAARAAAAPVVVPRVARPPDPALGEGAHRSRLVVHKVGSGDGARTVVELGRPAGPTRVEAMQGTEIGILARELVRQAMLLAARDELGLETRDEVLGDAPPDAAAGPPVVVGSLWGSGPDRPSKIAVLRGEGDAPERLVDREAAPVPDGLGVTAMIVPIVEALSREEFPKALKALGAVGKPNAVRADAGLPPRVEERLEGLSYFDHLAALRDLHAAMRAEGESPERLVALARGYAQLGVLSEFQWHPAHKAYKARALLYAQRLAARDPASARALWGRALVKALIGQHNEALDDLAAAARLTAGKKEPVPPAWVSLVDAYSRDDVARLEGAGGPHSKLAGLFRLLANEHPPTGALALRAAQQAIELDPDCYRAHEALCLACGVSNLHVATTLGLQHLTESLPGRLKALEGLPADVRRAVETDFDELKVVKVLDRAGRVEADPGEPSWSALAHLIRETRFVQVYERLKFLKGPLAVPTDEFWAGAVPVIADHRYRPYLEFFHRPTREKAAAFAQFAKDVDPTDLESTEYDMLVAPRPLPDGQARVNYLLGVAFGHLDDLARDMARYLNVELVPLRLTYARRLLQVVPASPHAMSVLIANDWDSVQEKLPDWEKSAGLSPTFLNALGRKYSELKRYDEADRYLERAIKESPEQQTFLQLADNAKARGDMDAWRRWLDAYIEHGEDHGLGRAGVQVKIANYLMDQKCWEEARSYADDAAATWAGWAMQCAARCHEGLGEWDQAELWHRRSAERYPGTSWTDWYVFCQRTGHGDLAAARQFVEDYLKETGERPDLVHPWGVAHILWLEGQPEKAVDAIAKQFEIEHSPHEGVEVFLVADAAGDTARRDAALEELCTKLKDKAPKTISLCQMMRDELADPAKHPLDLAAVDGVIDSIPEEGKANARFPVGMYLRNHGRSEMAAKYLKPASESPNTTMWWRAIAADATRNPAPRPKP